ncbi:MAG: tetratricopeptide repeat protein [Defluviicoccus sp.]|nr:MAG: tetratricopeptide repeat protein [Defluviicoccus sp.]
MTAVLTLQGGADLDGAQAAIEEENAALGFATAARPLRTALREALPAADGGRLAAIVPDLIGEAFVIAVLTDRSLSAREQADVVARSRGRAPEPTLASVMRIAQDFADGEQHPSLRWLDALTERCETPLALMQLHDAFPHETLVLRERAAAATAALAVRLAGSESDDEELKATRALLLNNASVRLSALGRREEALSAAEEAVSVYRELAGLRPDAFRPDLALSLNNYANFLSALGRREEALSAAEEAVTIRRELAGLRPDAFRPDLATSLSVLADCLEAVGDTAGALLMDCESVALLTEFLRAGRRAMWG